MCIRDRNKHTALFGIVQGGLFKDLRLKSLNDLKKIGFDGYAIGGLAVGDTQDEMFNVLDYLKNHMPKDKPRYLMGVGTPSDILGAVKRGIDMFDCVLPTRSGRTGLAFTWNGRVHIRNSKYKNDKNIQFLSISVDPVNDIFFTKLLSQKTLPIGDGSFPNTKLITPGGNPATSAKCNIAVATNGVSSEGLITTVHPAAKAGATFLVIIAKGKFQGVIAATTPIGCFNTTILLSTEFEGIISPYILLPSSANHLINDAPYKTSPLLSLIGLPHSKVIISARSLEFSIIRLHHFSKISERYFAVLLLQDENALFAASTAFFAILAPPSKTLAIFLLFEVLKTTKYKSPSDNHRQSI